MATDTRALIRALTEIPREFRRELRAALTKAGRPVLREAKRRASYSSRIPGALRLSVILTGKSPSVAITANKERAPHARPLENLGEPGTFRHPVFGNRSNWVSQRARPFMAPAITTHADESAEAVADAVDKASRKHGFH